MLRLRKVGSLAQDSESPPPTGLSFQHPLALQPGGEPSLLCRPQEPFFLWKPDLLPSSSAPPGLASWGAPNSHLTYLRPGPSLRPLLGLIHFSLSPRPARWISPIFHPSHLGPCQGRAVSSRLFNMCEAICQNSAPTPHQGGGQLHGETAPASVSWPSWGGITPGLVVRHF